MEQYIILYDKEDAHYNEPPIVSSSEGRDADVIFNSLEEVMAVKEKLSKLFPNCNYKIYKLELVNETRRLYFSRN